MGETAEGRVEGKAEAMAVAVMEVERAAAMAVVKAVVMVAEATAEAMVVAEKAGEMEAAGCACRSPHSLFRSHTDAESRAFPAQSQCHRPHKDHSA